jgi:hypothetical protein
LRLRAEPWSLHRHHRPQHVSQVTGRLS